MHEISSKFSPSESQSKGGKNSLDFDLEIGEIYIAEQISWSWWIVETLFIVFRIETRKFAAFVPKHGNERLILHRITIFFSNALRKKDAQLTSYRPQNFPKYRFFDSPSTSNTISHLQNFFHRLIKKEKEKKERSISRNIAQRSETLVENWRHPRRGIVSSYLEEKRFWERRRERKKKKRRRNAALRGTFPSSLG